MHVTYIPMSSFRQSLVNHLPGICSLSPTLFFLAVAAPTKIYTLSLHDALPIYPPIAINTIELGHHMAAARCNYGRIADSRTGPVDLAPAPQSERSHQPLHRNC